MIIRRFLHSLVVFLLLWPPASAQTIQSNWVSVKDYGATGDGVTDDTAAILKAVNSAIDRNLARGAVVYFPPVPVGYRIDTQLELPATGNKWVQLIFDGPLLLHATLVPNSAYVLRGNSSSTFEAFSKDAIAAIEVWPEAQPAILIEQKAGIRLENLQVFYIHHGDGIVINNSADVTLKSVYVDLVYCN